MKNVAASVRARLSNLGKAEGFALDFMIERFAMGRLLWRLSKSPEARRFITIPVSLAGAQVRLQIDIGFGDVVTPEAQEHTWNELLGFPAAKLQTYPPETVVAEKLEAAVQLDINNSRMKDFFDLDWLARHRSFDFGILRKAITRTFERRGTTLPQEPPFALTREFATDATKQVQWKAFLRKNRLEGTSLEDLVARLNRFLLPLLTDNTSKLTWESESGWTQKPS